MKSYLVDLRTELQSGKTQSEMIALMKQRGMAIIDAIRSLRELYSISLGDAKESVTSHPDWAEPVAEAIPLQEEFIRSLEELDN